MMPDLHPETLANARRNARLAFATFPDTGPISFRDAVHRFELGPDLEPRNVRPAEEDTWSDDRDAERGPCQAMTYEGILDTGTRCGRPESDPAHDPLGHHHGAEVKPHVFDPLLPGEDPMPEPGAPVVGWTAHPRRMVAQLGLIPDA